MTAKELADRANSIAQTIIDDLTMRSGFDALWEEMDRPTKREIKKDIASVVATQMSDLLEFKP